MSTANDDAESVDQFLARIASLKDRHDREDEERTRKLEEEILQGRKQRQARRAERARSISPSKDSPAPSQASTIETKIMTSRPIDPPVEFAPRSQTQTPTRSPKMDHSFSARYEQELSAPPSSRALPTPPVKSPSTPTPTPPPASTLGRSGTLSWQQRPSSRDSNSSRQHVFSASPAPPLSAENKDAPLTESVGDLSRSQIAQSLGSKDPSWFRQTADRGHGSAAYRRHETEKDTNNLTAKSMRLPGMSQDGTMDIIQSPAESVSRMQNPYAGDVLTIERPAEDHMFAVPARASTPSQIAPFIEPTHVALTPSQSFGSSGRPLSPTKGLGGFVQSAMMKRSDSVNKRWSVQAAPGLKRSDSVASNRNTLSAAAGGPAGSPPRQIRPLQRPLSSSPASSRPASSHSTHTNISNSAAQPEPSTTEKTWEAPKIKPDSKQDIAPQRELQRQSGLSPSRAPKENSLSDEALPVSPTKTIDSRRWSPTKSSWLESALSRPESPQILSPKPDQPTWKSDLQKSKAAKSSLDLRSPPAANFEVNTASLLRSPPVGGHSRPLSISGLPEYFSSGVVMKSTSASEYASIVEEEKGKRGLQQETTQVADRPSQTSKPENEIMRNQGLQSALGRELPSNGSSTMPLAKREPPAVKAKPQTPPKTDFRSNLKLRKVGSTDNGTAEPEFKAVFGKLKRTQTQNYVAPDELKDNITRSKAALNLTDGPQKSKRVDEFKESILQKKEAMKASSEQAQKLPVAEKPATPLPEALAKRQLLGKAPSSSIREKSRGDLDSAAPISVARFPKGSEKPAVTQALSAGTPALTDPSSKPSATIKDNPSPQLPESAGFQPSVASTSAIKQEMATSKLAARLNPALAGILSRGSSPKPTSRQETMSSEDLTLNPWSHLQGTSEDSDKAIGGALTHMTKARARGPKRRVPKAETPAQMKAYQQEPERAQHKDLGSVLPAKSIEVKPNKPIESTTGNKVTESPKPISLPDLAGVPEVKREPDLTKPPVKAAAESRKTPKPKPVVVTKSPVLSRVSSPPPKPIVTEVPSSPVKDRMRAFDIAQDSPRPSSNNLSTRKADSSSAFTSSAAASPFAVTSTTRLNSPRALNPMHDTPQKVPVATNSKPVGLGLNVAPTPKRNIPSSSKELTPPADKPSFAAKPAMNLRGGQLSSTSSIEAQVAEFFDQSPRSADKAEFDTQAVLTTRVGSGEKARTLNMQIWEVKGDGKKETMPPQQEHILFEESMYMCVHTFQGSTGSKTTEAYFWVGDSVPDAAVEDAQLFGRKIARENSAKLEVVKQGMEGELFFQALGGIVVTRRSKSSALYMLCGRRHLGHIAFDEVDLALSNLCSGFPYIVSAKFGKLYLWKGRGSGADELGCARLIGMDLGLTGEIEEINEGEEPAAFFESFNDKKKDQSTDLWELKSSQDAYACRLYRVEHERPKSAGGFWGRRGSSPGKPSTKALVEEISPFCQRDLDHHHIHLLDAYFEIYVLVGNRAASKSSEFATALLLAQEISILSPSLQDRPLMPVCYVVFGEPPRDLQYTFRKWKGQRKKAESQAKVLPLNEVIDALL